MGANSGQDAEIATTGARLLSPTLERHSCRCRVNAAQCVLVSLRGGGVENDFRDNVAMVSVLTLG